MGKLPLPNENIPLRSSLLTRRVEPQKMVYTYELSYTHMQRPSHERMGIKLPAILKVPGVEETNLAYK